MNRSIQEKVVELAAKQAAVAPDQVTPAHHFINDLNYDSLDRMEFAMSLEEEFELSVPDESVDQFQTVGDVVEFVEKQLSRSAA